MHSLGTSFLELTLPLSPQTHRLDIGVQTIGGYFIIGPPERPLARLRKRTAYPQTYAHQVAEHVVVLGYGSENLEPDEEFLQIFINHTGRVAIQRDTYATLPLFYGDFGHQFLLSNIYEYVAGNAPQLTVNRQQLIESLIPTSGRYATLWQEIGILAERHTLEITPEHGVRLRQPESRQWTASGEAPRTDPRLFKQTLEAHLDTFIDSFANRSGFAFEVSGGLDSATLPLYYAKKQPNQSCPSLGGMVFPGAFQATQMEKLHSIQKATGAPLSLSTIDPTEDYPLARMVQDKQLRHYYYPGEIYVEALDKLAARLADQGVHNIASGMGGDELFENTLSDERQLHYGASEQHYRVSMTYPPFATMALRYAYIDSTPTQALNPLPLLSVSLSGGHTARNSIYIAHDIWPMSPFADTSLYEYCQGLPPHFRANKNILRAFHHAYTFPEIIYNPLQNEDFGPFFETSFASGAYDTLLHTLIKHSITRELGLIDTDALLRAYQMYKTEPYGAMYPWLFHIYRWLGVEINLQATHTRKVH